MEGLGADSDEKHAPASDIDTATADCLKDLNPTGRLEKRTLTKVPRISAGLLCTALSPTQQRAIRRAWSLARPSIQRRHCLRPITPGQHPRLIVAKHDEPIGILVDHDPVKDAGNLQLIVGDDWLKAGAFITRAAQRDSVLLTFVHGMHLREATCSMSLLKRPAGRRPIPRHPTAAQPDGSVQESEPSKRKSASGSVLWQQRLNWKFLPVVALRPQRS